MRRLPRLHTRLTTLSSIVAIICSITTSIHLHAQQVGEWITVDRKHDGSYNSWAMHVAAAVKGHYVVVTQENASVGPYTIRRTTDGGARWDVMRSDPAEGRRIRGIAHPRPEVIVVIGDTSLQFPYILRSTDAGVTWQQQELPATTTLHAIAMDADGSGAILGMRGQQGALFTTVDAGATWIERPIPSDLGTPTLLARSSSTHYVVIAGTNALRTADRGATWSASPMPQRIAAITFADSLNGWGVGGTGTGVGQTQRDLIIRTTDGGATWSTAIDSVIPFAFGLRDIDFSDRDHGVAVGKYSKILRTSDGGATWTQDWPHSDLVTEYTDLLKVATPASDDAVVVSGSSGYVIRYTGRQRLAAPFFTRPTSGFDALPLETLLEWRPVTGALWYDLQAADTTVEYNYVNHRMFDVPYLNVTDLSSTFYTAHLQPEVRYAFRVRARSASDTSDWSPQLQAISTTTSSVPRPVTPGAMKLSVHPLPAHGHASVALHRSRPGIVHLHLLDALGEKLATSFSGALSEGDHIIPLDLSSYPSGAYYVMIDDGEQRATVMLVNTR